MKHIPAHFIVGCTWDFVKVNDLDVALGSVNNKDWNISREANLNGIQIEVVGNFNLPWVLPSEAQYNMVRTIISRINEKHPWMEIKRHWDFQPKNCPWVNFDMARLTNITSTKPVYKTILTWLDKKLMDKVCDVWINGRTSPLCHQDKLFLELKAISQSYQSGYKLFKLQLGINYKESHIGANYVKPWAEWANNWWGTKTKRDKNDKILFNYYNDTALYAFGSIQEFRDSQAHMLMDWYISQWMKDPKSISWKYVTGKVGVKESRYPAVNTFYYLD